MPAVTGAPAPSVRRLTLRGDGIRASTVLQLFDSLNLPNLETLELVDVANCGETANIAPTVAAPASVPVPISPIVGAPPVFPPVPVVVAVAAPHPPHVPFSPLSGVLEHTRRSGCRITSLVLRRTPVGCAALKALLEGLPYLERLEISDEAAGSSAPSPSPGNAKYECETNLDPALAWLSSPVPLPPCSPNDVGSPSAHRGMPRPNLHTLIIYDTKPLFSLGAMLGILKTRSRSMLTAVDVMLPATRVSGVHLERCAALAVPGGSTARLRCLDEKGRCVRVGGAAAGWDGEDYCTNACIICPIFNSRPTLTRTSVVRSLRLEPIQKSSNSAARDQRIRSKGPRKHN
ncbi:hypothetical protein DFH06DRAFT_1141307 [Mycena polygramma]|nr:hypothetical protein DFH06DRAFT_1141307 [Mycena polygramma]